MEFSQHSKTIQLCIRGMESEGQGLPEEARALFYEAWDIATNGFEKFTAAHYVARHQKSIADKLQWDEAALQLALKINDEAVKETYPSLYLNIGKCYEDLNDFDNARKNYYLALSFSNALPDNGYGNMVRGGIKNGIQRVAIQLTKTPALQIPRKI